MSSVPSGRLIIIANQIAGFIEFCQLREWYQNILDNEYTKQNNIFNSTLKILIVFQETLQQNISPPTIIITESTVERLRLVNLRY